MRGDVSYAGCESRMIERGVLLNGAPNGGVDTPAPTNFQWTRSCRVVSRSVDRHLGKSVEAQSVAEESNAEWRYCSTDAFSSPRPETPWGDSDWMIYSWLMDRGQSELANRKVISSSEKRLKKALLDCGVKFEHEYFLNGKTYDFRIVGYPILIEQDGSIHKWKKEVKRNDKIKDFLAEMSGYELIRVSECLTKRSAEAFVMEKLVSRMRAQDRRIERKTVQPVAERKGITIREAFRAHLNWRESVLRFA